MKTIISRMLFWIAMLCLAWVSAFAASENETKTFYQPKPMDGVLIEAVETYPNPHDQEVGVGIGLYPFNAYYSGILLNANYQYSLDRNFTWELLNASYAFTFDKGLSTELADRFGVNPERIDRLSFVLSTNVMYSHANGKFIFLREYIRYFRSSALGGLGLVKTSETQSISVNLGLRFEVFTSESFAWRFDVRDQLTLSGFNNFVTFTIGSGISF